jgi:CBS domain-containing protein
MPRIPFTSPEQLMPFPTAGELLAPKRDPLISVAPDASVFDAVRLMTDRNIGFLVVLEGGALVGCVSDRDCARRVILESRNAADMRVSEIMATRVHTVSREAKITECVMLMHAHGVRHLAVSDAGKVHGVISVRDVMGALVFRHERLLRRLQEERLTLMVDTGNY